MPAYAFARTACSARQRYDIIFILGVLGQYSCNFIIPPGQVHQPKIKKKSDQKNRPLITIPLLPHPTPSRSVCNEPCSISTSTVSSPCRNTPTSTASTTAPPPANFPNSSLTPNQASKPKAPPRIKSGSAANK